MGCCCCAASTASGGAVCRRCCQKPSTIEAARSAPQAAYFVPARDVSLGRGSPTPRSLGRSYDFVEGTARRVASRLHAHGTCAGAQPRYLSQTRAIEGKNSLFLGAGPANNFMLLFVQRHWNSNSAVPQRVRGHVTVYHVPLYFNEKEIRTEEAVKSAQRSAANTESCQATADYFALR